MSLSAQPQPYQAVPPAPVFPPYPATLVMQGTEWRAQRAFGSQAPLFKPRIYIGKLASNDIILSDSFTSRVHAAISWTPSGYEIEDLRSTNGVYVNGVRINGRALLQPGQVIHIGHTDMTFYALQGAPWPGQATNADTRPSTPPMAPPMTPQPLTPMRQAPVMGQPPMAPAGYAAGGVALPAGGYGAWGRPTAVPAPFQHPGVSPSRGSRVGMWISAESRKAYWKVFLVGIVLLIGAEILLSVVGPLGLLAVVPIASALMPVTFFIYCWDADLLADMPRWIPWVVFCTSAVLGVALAMILETIFVGSADTLTGALLVGLIEESCKALAVIWVLFIRKLHSEIDGVILGAAAGAGFATLETMGYALNSYFEGHPLGQGIAMANGTLLLRGLLAIFGHVTWTAIVVGAIWRDRGQSHFKLTLGVIVAFLAAVVLHGMWDGLGYLGIILAAVIGFWLLHFFLREAVARERLGAYAPPPPPLLSALWYYFLHPLRDPLSQRVPAAPAPAPAMFSGSWSVAPAQVWAPPPPPAYLPTFQPAPGAQPRTRVCANGHPTTDPAALYCRRCGAPLGA